MMAALTTRQRDILRLLLDADSPLAVADLAGTMHLSPRQVRYGLKGLQRWLAQQEISLEMTPGVGVSLTNRAGSSSDSLRRLYADTRLQLVLTPEQRQQLLALFLLDTGQPAILQQLEQMLGVSRTTVLTDLDAIEPWLEEHTLRLERRPNYGIEVQGSEQARRQALGAWAWGATPFGPPLASVTHSDGISFELVEDSNLLPIAKNAAEIVSRWDVTRLFGQVAYAEAQLGGRFSDDAVLYLALVFAIQTVRVEKGNIVDTPPSEMAWLQSHSVWPVAQEIAKRLRWGVGAPWPESEVVFLVRYLLAAPRNERWPGDLDVDSSFAELIDQMMRHIGNRYEMPSLENDKMLRDGIVVQAIPAYLRQHFQLWLPSLLPTSTLSSEYLFEHQVAEELATMFAEELDATLARGDIDNIALLLRAAYIRERPYRLSEVIVICPSGMASAQLLVARLRARFPRLGEPAIFSVRELTLQDVNRADLVLTTVPLRPELQRRDNVLQVHQLLFPGDVEAITAWLSSR